MASSAARVSASASRSTATCRSSSSGRFVSTQTQRASTACRRAAAARTSPRADAVEGRLARAAAAPQHKTNGSPAGRAAGAGPAPFVTFRPAGKQNGATSSVRSSSASWRGKAQSARGMTTPGSVGWMASDGGRRCFFVAPARRRTAAAQRCATVRFGARRVSRVSVVAIVSSCAASQARGRRPRRRALLKARRRARPRLAGLGLDCAKC